MPATREAIAAVGIERLLAAQAELKGDLMVDPDPDRWGAAVVASTMPWQPVIDGEVLPGPPIERIAAGSAAQVDVIVGTNTDDWRLWIMVSGVFAQITDEILTGPVRTYGYQSMAAYGLPVEQALVAYRARYPEAGPGDLLAAVQTDWWVRIPAIRLAEAHADSAARTYMYEFAWPSPGLGAVHALEVPFVFDKARADAPLFGPLLGETRRRSSQMRCTPPGSPSRRTAIRVGRGTTAPTGRRCGSTRPLRWCTIRERGSGRCGTASADCATTI